MGLGSIGWARLTEIPQKIRAAATIALNSVGESIVYPEMFHHMAFISLPTSGFSNTLKNHMTNCRPRFKRFGSVVRQVGVHFVLSCLFTFA